MTRLGITLIAVLAVFLAIPLQIWHLKAARKPAGKDAGETTRTPVLLELFTSEGCSSCPPADELLEKLDRSQPISGAELIVLSEHVDYWNHIGWKDPFSSHQFSERQSDYAGRFGLNGVYTPQLVVDGHIEVVGSDERGAIRAVENAAKAEKVQLRLSSIRFEGSDKISLHVEAGPLPPALGIKAANIFLAIADDSDESQVSGGENAGSTLKHVAVLRNLVTAGTIGRSDKFSRDVTVEFGTGKRADLRIVGIIQGSETGRVLGASLARLQE